MAIYVIPGFWTPERCEAVRGLFPEPAAAAVNVDATRTADRPDLRKSRVAFMKPEAARSSPVAASATGDLLSVMAHANKKAFQFDITAQEPMQLAEYHVGEHYDWHLDLGPGPAGLRKLSASIQLTPPAEYDGGELEMWGAPEKVDRVQGTLVIFPSYLLHRVTPVTRGVRRSLVVWATGTTPFR